MSDFSDMQHLINIGLSIIIGGLGWFGRQLWQMIQDVRKDLQDHREEVPTMIQTVHTDLHSFKQAVSKDYVPRGDYREDMDRVFEKLDRIIERLGEKADRPK